MSVRNFGFYINVTKRQDREGDHWTPSSAEVKNAWSYTSIPPPTRPRGVVLS
jgi:hypothetical protein